MELTKAIVSGSIGAIFTLFIIWITGTIDTTTFTDSVILLLIIAIAFSAKSFWNYIVCQTCGGSGKEICSICVGGYRHLNLQLDDYRAKLIKRKGKYILKLENLIIRNRGWAGSAKIDLQVAPRVDPLDRELRQTRHMEKYDFDTGEDITIKGPFEFNFGTLDEFKKLVRQEPKKDHFFVAIASHVIERKKKCSNCGGTGYIKCFSCNGKRIVFGSKDSVFN